MYKEIYQSLVTTEARSTNNREFVAAPESITTPYPFIAIGDLTEVVSRISPDLLGDEGIAQLQRELLSLQKQYAPERSTFYYLQQTELVGQIEALLNQEITEQIVSGKTVGVINFDRYILSGETPNDVLRLNLSRGADGTLVTRPGLRGSKEDQFNNLENWLRQGQYDQIVLVDDVVAFATTFPPVIERITQVLPDVQISVVSGICSTQGDWSGQEKLQSLGITVKAVTFAQASSPIEGGSSGMAIPDSRDSTIFGGKIGWAADGRALSYPYFYPFSEPTTSLMEAEKNREASAKWLEYNLDLVQYLEQCLERKLLVGDLESASFGIPYTSIKELQTQIDIPASDVELSTYLLSLRKLEKGTK